MRCVHMHRHIWRLNLRMTGGQHQPASQQLQQHREPPERVLRAWRHVCVCALMPPFGCAIIWSVSIVCACARAIAFRASAACKCACVCASQCGRIYMFVGQTDYTLVLVLLYDDTHTQARGAWLPRIRESVQCVSVPCMCASV